MMTNSGLKKSPNASSVSTTINTGSMTGTVTKKNDGGVFEFSSNNVSLQTTSEGQLRVQALMRHPDADQDARIEFRLANKDAPSGTYVVPSQAVDLLLLSHPFSMGYFFNAIAGQIIFNNHAPEEVRATGSLTFETENKFGEQYDVKMEFEATGIR